MAKILKISTGTVDVVVTEQFEDACFEKWRENLMNKDVNEQVEHWLSLSLRIFESY